MTTTEFLPSRTAALERLKGFAPRAGRDYAQLRNYDLPGHPHVSRLSPYIRHRVLTEEEVLRAVLNKWSASSAEKFVQEVIWRSYFKGWLEHRPKIWSDYRNGVQSAWNRLQSESGLRMEWEAACSGRTGIDCFDHWAQELVETGYLHNHARMWFASIWIFTLRLPWELGADFFLRHLLDGDPASNTLGWRWVAGLHTQGKHYVARASNIAEYTEGRFQPQELSQNPEPLSGPVPPPTQEFRAKAEVSMGVRTGLVLTEEDLSPGFAIGDVPLAATYVVDASSQRSPLHVSPIVERFTQALIKDCLARFDGKLGSITKARTSPNEIDLVQWAGQHRLEQIVLSYLPAGPAADLLLPQFARLSEAGVRIVEVQRDCDVLIWPHATAGFFKVKKQIPSILEGLGLGQERRARSTISRFV